MQLADDADVSASTVAEPRAVWPGDQERLRAGSKRGATPSAAHSTLDDAFDVEEIDLRARRRTSARVARAGPREGDAARFARGREPRADFEQPDIAPAVPAVVRDRVDQAGQQRRPQHVEFCRQRVGDRDERIAVRLRETAAAFDSMKPNVTASDRPAAVQTRRTRLSRPVRGSGGGAATVIAGKLGSSLS